MSKFCFYSHIPNNNFFTSVMLKVLLNIKKRKKVSQEDDMTGNLKTKSKETTARYRQGLCIEVSRSSYRCK